ncbi:MAG: hypothetical protein ACXACI_05855 [Candidatus Hodarchaeales archaeon]
MAQCNHLGDSMVLDEFKEYLKERELNMDQIKAVVDIVKEFSQFLADHDKSIDNAVYDDLFAFSADLIEKKKNSFDNYVGVLRYGHFKKNNEVIIASMEILDGSEIFENFSKRLTEEFGSDIRDRIFGDLEVPPLGLHPQKKPEITKQLIERFLAEADREDCIEFLAQGLRDKYTESYRRPRELFLEAGNIDKFLKAKHQNFVKTLEKHLQEKTLFFTQEVDEQVIDYVKSDQTIEAGVRKGDQVIISKIPYMTKQYLAATDETNRRYYYCHCPVFREALQEEAQPVDPIFCHCSGGYYKNFWEAVLEQPVKVDLRESILLGNDVCKFALTLPPGFLDEESSP